MPIISGGGGGGGTFNGGTVTGATDFAVAADAVGLTVTADPTHSSDVLDVFIGTDNTAFIEPNGALVLTGRVGIDDNQLLITSSAGQTRNALQVQDSTTAGLFGVGVNGTTFSHSHIIVGDLALGLLLQGPHAAPADGDLNAGELALWFDQTNGAAKLMVKAKQADGTVRTAAIALA